MASKLQLICVILVLAKKISTLTFQDSPANETALSTLAVDTTLHCSAVAPSPPYLVSWKHNDAYVNASSRTSTRYDQVTGQSSFTISGGVVYSDGGAYQCAAFDAQGNILALSAIGYLTVVGPPLLLSTLSKLVVTLGGYAIFTAPSVTSNPPYSSFAWYNGSSLVQSSERVSVASSSLTINNVQMTDVGTYEYRVTNSYGTSNAYGSLTIGPSVDTLVHILAGVNRTATSNYILTEGDQLILVCSYAQGSNLVGVTWTRDLTTLTSHLTVGPTGLSYTLSAANRSDAGLYMCYAQNQQGGLTQASIQVDVQYLPYFTAVPTSRAVNYSTVPDNMVCQASSNPGPPTITWWNPSGQALVTNGGAPVLGPLRGRDSGTYTCKATNSVGSSSVGVTITVLDIPQVTISPSYLAIIQGMDATLTCIASASPPVTLVTWKDYRNNTVASNSSELFLPSISSFASGQYSCTATNSYGSQTAYVTIAALPVQPTVSVLPVLTAAVLGRPFTLVCSLSLRLPGSIISWFVNNVPLATFDPSAVLFNANLTIPSSQMSHNGNYMCTVSIGQLTFTGSGQVIVGVPPTSLTPSTIIRAQPGSSVVLPCNATGSPTPLVQWSRVTELGESQALSLVGTNFRVNSEGLLFTSVVREDSGWYRGSIQNIFGTAQCYARLQVAGAPLILNVTPTTIIATYNFTLNCAVAYNYPQVTVLWTRANNAIIPSNRTFRNGTSLTISPVIPSDEGFYRCYVSNDYGTSTYDQFITVLVPPTITLPTSPVIVLLEEDAHVSCIGAGKPLPYVQWIAGDVSSLPSDHIEISGSETNQTLFIYNVTYRDEGIVFSCNASNVVSSTVTSIVISVRGAPPTSASANFTTSRSIAVSWEPPENAKDLLNYQLSYTTSVYTTPSIVYNIPVSSPYYYISGLHPATTYTVSVQGMYANGIQGLSVQMQITTMEEAPSSPPLSVTVTSAVESLIISWQPPPLYDQNGVISLYNIYYELIHATSFRSTSSSGHVVYIPTDTAAPNYTYVVESLPGGSTYNIKMNAATKVGNGPNSTAVSAVTLKSFPLTTILVISIPGGTFGILILIIIFAAIFASCRRSQKHSTLKKKKGTHSMDIRNKKKHKDSSDIAEIEIGEGYKEKDFKSGKKKGRIEISGPIPSIPPRTEVIGPSKLTVMDKSGIVVSWHPYTITAEDMAPPPPSGGTVQMVSHRSLPSTYRREEDNDRNLDDSFDQSPQNVPQQSPQGRYSGIYAEPDVEVHWGGLKTKPPNHFKQSFLYDERSSQASDDGNARLEATKNSFDLTLQTANDNTDGSNALYSTVPKEHISMKRFNRMQLHQGPEQQQQHPPVEGSDHTGDDPVQEDDVTFREDTAPSPDGTEEQRSYSFSQGVDNAQETGELQVDRQVLIEDASLTKAQKKALQKEQKEWEKSLEKQRKEEAKRRKERQKILAQARKLQEKERKREEKEKRNSKTARDLDVMMTPHFDVNSRSRALFDNAASSIF